jgi:hypothetical protein
MAGSTDPQPATTNAGPQLALRMGFRTTVEPSPNSARTKGPWSEPFATVPRTEVLIFTMHDNESLIQELLKAGARGYLLKTDARRHLIGAIEALAAHKPFFTARSRRRFLIPSFHVPHGMSQL